MFKCVKLDIFLQPEEEKNAQDRNRHGSEVTDQNFGSIDSDLSIEPNSKNQSFHIEQDNQ